MLKWCYFLVDVFGKNIKVSVKKIDNNPLYRVSLPSYTWQCGLKNTGINLQTLQVKDTILLIENDKCERIGLVMGDRHIKSVDNEEILHVDGTHLYGWAMSWSLPYDEIEMWYGNPDPYVEKLEEILNSSDDSNIRYFLEVDLSYPDNIEEKHGIFDFVRKTQVIPKDKYNDYMNMIKLKNYTKGKQLLCDWTDEKNYLIQYRMLKFYIRHGMIVDKILGIISYKQIKWLVKYKSFNKQKWNKAKKIFEKDFCKLLNNAFYGKTMEKVRNRIRLEFFKKYEYKKIIGQHSKLTLSGIHKSYQIVIVIHLSKLKFWWKNQIIRISCIRKIKIINVWDLLW